MSNPQFDQTPVTNVPRPRVSSLTRAMTLALATCLAGNAMAQAEETIPQQAVSQANAVIDAAVAAYGGAEAINGLNSVTRESKFTTWATNQSKRPGPPWDENSQFNLQAIDFDKQTFVAIQKGHGGGYDFDNRQLLIGEESWNVDNRAGTVTERPNPDFDTQSGPFIRITAPLLVKQLLERRATSYWLGETEFEGRPHDIVTLVMEVGPALSLYFDKETHLLSRSERVLQPFGQVDYRFSAYETFDGVPFATEFKLYANGQPNLYVDYSATQVNQPLDQYTGIPESFELVTGVAQPTDVELQELEDGVFLVGAGGTYMLFVEMDDHVVAVGGTGGAPDRVAKLRESVPDKPIRFAVLTHHHNDHLLAVPSWEAEGATVLTVAEHEAVVRGTAQQGDELALQFVEDRYVFESGDQRLEIVDVGPTPHTDHLLVAWLPEHEILFEADHFPNPINGQMGPAQPVTVALAKAMGEKDLRVSRIVGAHSPRVASMQDMRTALNKAPKNSVAAKVAKTKGH